MGKVPKLSASIALDSKDDKTFKRNVKKFQKRLKQKQNEPKDAYLERGLIYLNHLPPGFVEEGIRGYFQQFGDVTNVRVLRSKRTGNSKGAAFIEFQEPEVAKIAAETMDNYLMFKRRLECTYVELEKRNKNLFKYRFTAKHCPANTNRNAHRRSINQSKTPEQHVVAVKKSLKKLKKKNMLGFCQVVNLNVDVGMNDEINPLDKKKEVKVKKEKPKKAQKVSETVSVKSPAKKSKKNTAKKEEFNTSWHDESLVISPKVLSPKKGKVKVKSVKGKKEEKTSSDVKKSLKTIQKTKDKQKKVTTEALEKIVSKVAVSGKKGKAQLILDPSLVTQVNFTEQKAKKGSVKTKKTKKALD